MLYLFKISIINHSMDTKTIRKSNKKKRTKFNLVGIAQTIHEGKKKIQKQ
jgi:hypothetical protein